MSRAGSPLPEPFDWRPGRLWSLWDMIAQYGWFCVTLSQGVERCIACYRELKLSERFNPPLISRNRRFIAASEEMKAEAEKLLHTNLPSIKRLASVLSLRTVTAQAGRVEELLARGGRAETIEAALSEIAHRIMDEMEHEKFVHIKSSRAVHFETPNLFGEGVADKFSAAIDDIEEAGKCLALERGTACVLHLMRVMEVGLKALGNVLGIPYAPSWESYLLQIAAQIGQKRPHKAIDWIKDEPFFRDVSGDLMTVKQAWRNPTMHVVRKYSIEEADEIFSAVRAFMKRLASHAAFASASAAVSGASGAPSV